MLIITKCKYQFSGPLLSFAQGPQLYWVLPPLVPEKTRLQISIVYL